MRVHTCVYIHICLCVLMNGWTRPNHFCQPAACCHASSNATTTTSYSYLLHYSYCVCVCAPCLTGRSVFRSAVASTGFLAVQHIIQIRYAPTQYIVERRAHSEWTTSVTINNDCLLCAEAVDTQNSSKKKKITNLHILRLSTVYVVLFSSLLLIRLVGSLALAVAFVVSFAQHSFDGVPV